VRAAAKSEISRRTRPGGAPFRARPWGSPTERDMDRDGKNGISVIICCLNSVSKLLVTLAHLEAQEPPAAPWELLIIDNESTDGSADFARRDWKSDRIPLRVVEEPRLGVRFARERGLSESRYPFLAFVDDDNWLAPDWVRTAYEIISSDESLLASAAFSSPSVKPQRLRGSMTSTPYMPCSPLRILTARATPQPIFRRRVCACEGRPGKP
jgi:cellulose synthase/poly-beta-1,6-N-acetylglucosamine synthase-like glycosyltransferase